MSAKQRRFERRAAERACAKQGHLFPSKTDGAGRWIKLPCERCGTEPEAA